MIAKHHPARTLEDLRKGRRRKALTWPLAVLLGGVLGACQAVPADEEVSELYAQAQDRYMQMADQLHTVLMAIEPTVWAVDQGQHGAVPSGCQLGLSSSAGYSFTAVRTLGLPDRDAEEIVDAATAALLASGAQVEDSGAGEPRSGVTGSDDVARTSVSYDPTSGQVRVWSRTECQPGSAPGLTAAIYGQDPYPEDVWRRLPATEGPASVPQFFFPDGGPLFYDESGRPVDPQPVITVPPVRTDDA